MNRSSEDVLRAFAEALLATRFEQAHALLAPWLRESLTPADVAAICERGRVEGAPPPFSISELGISSGVSFDELQSAEGPFLSLQGFARGEPNDPEAGMYGPPAFALNAAINGDNFRAWGSFDLAPDPAEESGLDFSLRMFLAVVEIEGALAIGHFEPEVA